MSKILVADKIELFLVSEEPITLEAVEKLNHRHRSVYGNATLLRVSPNVYMELRREIRDIDWMIGLDVEVDPKLKKYEWRIGRSEETLRYIDG